MSPTQVFHSPWLTALAAVTAAFQLHGSPLTGRQFFSFTHFDEFEIQTLPTESGSRLISPLLNAGFAFDQLVVSWNVGLAPGAWLKIEAQPVFGGRTGSFYTLGYWSGRPTQEGNRGGPVSRSVPDQSDPDGAVRTDVLVLSRPAEACRIRLSIADMANHTPTVLKFVGVSVLNSACPPLDVAIGTEPVRGLALPVPTRSQLDYPGGGAWCSPTSLSMVLSYWATRLKRPDLDREVPEVAAAVHDPCWPGTGNWPFNAAYAGSFPGMRGYVTRLGNVGELEAWIKSGVPVVTSVTYSILKGQPDQGDGHLVVVVGFDDQGDVVINDPGSRLAMRKTVGRDRFVAAWSKSHNTVYLIHPYDHSVPHSEHSHW